MNLNSAEGALPCMRDDPPGTSGGEYKTVWTEDYPVRLNEIGPDARLRSTVLLDYLQDAAAAHAEVLGFGLSALKKLNILWVLSRIRFQMEELPKIGETVRITTYPSGVQKLFATRQYIISSARSGQRFGVGSSFWLTLDAQTFRPLNPLRALPTELPPNEHREFFFPDLGKLARRDCGNPEIQTVRSSQIDYNNHLNNAYYGHFTQDWLAARLKRLVHLRELQLNFSLSMPFDAKLTCSGAVDSDSFYVEGLSEDQKLVFQAKGRYSFL